MQYPMLYGKTKAGKIKEWSIKTVSFPGGSALIEMEHGLQGGKKIVSQQSITEGKNIGKSNETTPYEQACSEAQSRWKYQIDKGYAEDITNIKMGDERELFLPMLAQRYDKAGHKIKWPAYLQPKLDGCLDYNTEVELEGGTKTTIGYVVENRVSAKIKCFNIESGIVEYQDILGYFKDAEDVSLKGREPDWYSLELEDGRTLTVTGNHLVWLPSINAWRRVDDLSEGDLLLIC